MGHPWVFLRVYIIFFFVCVCAPVCLMCCLKHVK
ncbi:ORFL231W [Human betaherpesvirus 5]|nr:ORFL231W [Human betaherpesvirus 5]